MYRKMTIEFDVYINDSEGELTESEMEQNDHAVSAGIIRMLSFPIQNARVVADSLGRIDAGPLYVVGTGKA